MLFKDIKFKILEDFYLETNDISVSMFETADKLRKDPLDLFNEMKLSKIIDKYPGLETDIYLAYTVAIMLRFSDVDTDDIVLDNIKEILRFERGESDKPMRMSINLNLN